MPSGDENIQEQEEHNKDGGRSGRRVQIVAGRFDLQQQSPHQRVDHVGRR